MPDEARGRLIDADRLNHQPINTGLEPPAEMPPPWRVSVTTHVEVDRSLDALRIMAAYEYAAREKIADDVDRALTGAP